MKKIKIIAIAIIAVILLSCNEGKLNKKYVKDVDNNYYQLEWRGGDLYFLNVINTQEIDSLKTK
jgi:hypothetical protein